MVESTELRSLANRWRTEAKRFRQFEAHGQAAACEQLADELEAALDGWNLTPLTVREASEQSGYSEDHLRRLIRKGRIHNAGADNSPRVLRRDLPRKPCVKDGFAASDAVHLKEQIARSVADSKEGGSDG
jgi:hypothetical protein